MNDLKQDLHKRRAELGIVNSPFYGVTDRALRIQIEAPSGDVWILPWNHFLCSRHDPGADDAQLVLTFVAHRVMISGVNLDGIMRAISDQRLAWLRAVPGKYLESAGEDEPAIDRIKVLSLREPILAE